MMFCLVAFFAITQDWVKLAVNVAGAQGPAADAALQGADPARCMQVAVFSAGKWLFLINRLLLFILLHVF
jgi:hypothetical protein